MKLLSMGLGLALTVGLGRRAWSIGRGSCFGTKQCCEEKKKGKPSKANSC